MGAVFPPLAVCFLVWFARKDLKQAILLPMAFIVACVLTVAPWTIRINRHSDHFALLSYTTYLNLYIGNGSNVQLTPDGPWIDPKHHYRVLGRTRSQCELAAKKLALKAIWDRMPWWPFEKLRRQAPRFFSPNSFAVLRLLAGPDTRLSWWAYELRPDWLNRRTVRVVLVALAAGTYVVVVVVGVAGLILSRSKAMGLLLAVFIVAQLIPAVIAFACTRFRMGCMPAFIVPAAWVLSQPRALWAATTWRWRIAAIAGAVGMALLVSVRYREVLLPVW